MKIFKKIFLIGIFLTLIACGKNNNNNNKNDKDHSPVPKSKIENKYLEGSTKRVIDSENLELPEVQLMLSISKDNDEKILAELENVEDVNFILSNGDTPLAWAAFFFKEKTVTTLLEKGFIIDDKMISLETNPLHSLMLSPYADSSYAQARVLKVYNTLLSNGAKLGQKPIVKMPMYNLSLFWHALSNKLYSVCLDYLKENELSQFDIEYVWHGLHSYIVYAMSGNVADYHKVVVETAKMTDINIPVYGSSPEISYRDYISEVKKDALKYEQNAERRKEIKALFNELKEIVKEKEQGLN